ncbi:ABC transporter ATP-binding protein [Priestia aryabhattai]|uniref:ABC transporter ATP-binding protein n=1 Tax=Priestia TaxID=2800373 RepID=UPI00196A4D63|nr:MULTISPECIES: ABC transporter ATP-binding protein [Priestia]MED3820771.1 ABC transporter ATP-binding protein [Priestia aryabhattai]QSF33235.1 ABC transporter ATP-binding protein [Priestia megaterium]
MEPLLYYIKKLHSSAGKIIYFNVFGMAIASLMEGLGILLIIPLLSIGGVIEANTASSKLSQLFHFLTALPPSLYLPLILCMYVVIIIGQNLLQRSLAIRDVKIREKFSRGLRIEIYSLLLHSKWALFLKKRKSTLINLLTSELARVIGGINFALQLLSNTIFMIIQLAIALWLSVKMTLFIVLFGLILGYLSRKFVQKSRHLGRRTSQLGEDYMAGITDQLNGIKDIKSNKLEYSYIDWLRSLTSRMNAEQIEYVKLKSSSQLVYKVSAALLVAVFIFISVKAFHAQGEQLLLIILIFSRLWPRFIAIQSNFEQIAATLPACQAVKKLIEDCSKEQEFKQADALSPITETQIECKDVYFRYKKDSYTLKDINLTILPNQMTAIVGPSGAGKSTLIDLLMGLNSPERGEVLVNGHPLKDELLLSLRQAISYVPQDSFLFNTTVRENLLTVNAQASERELWEALEFAMADQFVGNLPQGLDTVIGDRGMKISGGERQRLVLARAILKKPALLILDEATSALDTNNENKIKESIDRLKGKVTIVVVAHRLSTIQAADQVLVLEEGKVIQKGSFNQLAFEEGAFHKLLEGQFQTV